MADIFGQVNLRGVINFRSKVWTNKQIESIKTTSMEDVSTRVLEKIKNI